MEQETNKMHKLFLIIGSLYGMLAVMLGAFGAHALQKMLESSGRMDTYETAVKYQFYHALLLLFIGWVLKDNGSKLLNYSGWAATIGVLIFSGSLYTICFTGIKTFGAVAPIGGTLLVAAWGILAYYFAKSY